MELIELRAKIDEILEKINPRAKVYDDENRDFYIDSIEYNPELDQVIIKFDSDIPTKKVEK